MTFDNVNCIMPWWGRGLPIIMGLSIEYVAVPQHRLLSLHVKLEDPSIKKLGLSIFVYYGMTFG